MIPVKRWLQSAHVFLFLGFFQSFLISTYYHHFLNPLLCSSRAFRPQPVLPNITCSSNMCFSLTWKSKMIPFCVLLVFATSYKSVILYALLFNMYIAQTSGHSWPCQLRKLYSFKFMTSWSVVTNLKVISIVDNELHQFRTYSVY